MENIFKQLGYDASATKESGEYAEFELLYINNPDGTIRWFWPKHLKKAHFLKFYNIGNLKSFAFSLVMKLIFFLKLQFFLFKRKTLFVDLKKRKVSDFNINGNWAVFTGTIGPNNKSIVYINENGLGSFFKLATTNSIKELLAKETIVLNRLYVSNIETFRFPEILEIEEDYIQLNDVSDKGIRVSKLTNSHIDALIEINEKTAIKLPLSEIKSWVKIKEDIKLLQNSDDKRLPKGLIKKINVLVNEINEEEEIEVSLSHGDFTPWNMYLNEDGLHIYDWELADPLKPIGFDLFHFIIQQGILVKRKPWLEIKKEIDQHVNCKSFSQLSKFKNKDYDKYLKLYLVFNAAYYLKLYAEQNLWHKQVYWLFNTWNDALSSFMNKAITNREALILDTFDFLLSKKYGAIKFPNMSPEKLTINSDIDLLVDKETKRDIIKFYKNHPNVQNSLLFKKSFMTSLQIHTKNNEILNLDLIVKVKRKHLELLNSRSILNNVYTNGFGVKMLDVYDNARYIGLFYALNKTVIPSKYNYYEELMSHSETALDKQLYPFYIDQSYSPKSLINFIKTQKNNLKLNGIKNRLEYIIDSIRTVLFNRGTIITFSGVDGAGKSTVIENLKQIVEKQLRKRVIVLRHRPSILPILSALTKGKKQAELDASMNLPRMGQNKSTISSVLRFAYYYTDYVIGQFLIHIKYVLKGYVVIYDRYYFDFINDSIRSNIKLPKFVFKTGFKLIMKPKFNFFLYADSDTILSRKKELDKATIEKLTSDYLTQFNGLSKKETGAKYISIKNVNLDETLHTVFDCITYRAA
ncbi:MAG: hypothetical protein SFY56_06600 [Bacteroidota bacterium]|nr:hypothetical protein [Bacteroidota bacterium]